MTEGGARTRCLQALARPLAARAFSGGLLFLLAFASAACSSRRDDAKEPGTRAPMSDDDVIAHVQGIFAKGGIGIFSFDETKDACSVDPTTMSASAFDECTGNVGLPTRVTTSIDAFDPSP
jgi:hypothetical protein